MDWIEQVLAVSAVLLLLAAFPWRPRRKALSRLGTGGSRKQALPPVQLLALGPRHSLHLVREAGGGLLVEISRAGCRVLALGRNSRWN